LVGEGLLAAAVCGGVFASPSVDEVLAAIRSVTGPAGCLLCLMNYTGDRLNFGLAAEMAKVRTESNPSRRSRVPR
jgi:dihydroxyacetone kinase